MQFLRRILVSHFALMLLMLFGNVAVSQPDPQQLPAIEQQDPDQRLSSLIERERQIRSVLERVAPSVVAVEGGTGVIVSSDGLMLTAAHVIKRPNHRVQVWLSDGRMVMATTLGVNLQSDTGMLKLDGSGPWPFLSRSDSPTVETGDWCLALGFPYSFPRGKPAAIRIGQIRTLNDFEMVVDCPVMGGDSGGPLLNLEGQLLGICSRVRHQVDVNVYLPLKRFEKDWDQLLASVQIAGSRKAAATGTYLGISGETDQGRVRVLQVHRGSPAERAGLRSDDVILQLEGERVDDFEYLMGLLAQRLPDEKVSVNINRFGKLISLKVKLAPRLDSGGQSPVETQAEPTLHTSEARFGLPQLVIREMEAGLDTADALASAGHVPTNIELSLAPILQKISPSVVKIIGQHGRISLGTIVTQAGLIVAKQSELTNEFDCVTSTGERYQGTLVGEYPSNDLALIKIQASGLTPIKFPQLIQPKVGSLMISVDHQESVVGFGVMSISPYRFQLQQPERYDQFHLGAEVSNQAESAKLRQSSGQVEWRAGLRVGRVEPRTAAEYAGLLSDDLIESINGQPVRSHVQLTKKIESIRLRQKLSFRVIRNGELIELSTVVNRIAPAMIPDRWGGGPFSERRFGFRTVLVHDSPVQPIHCGGPLVDLQGRVVGINVARSMRVATFAVPIEDVFQFIKFVKPDAILNDQSSSTN